MNDFFKPDDPFYDFLKKLMQDLPKLNDNHREPYIQIVEKLHPPLADVGQQIKQNLTPVYSFTPEQVGMLGYIHYRFKYDKSMVDVSTRLTLREKAEQLMESYTK